jgi:hypothetical protein
MKCYLRVEERNILIDKQGGRLLELVTFCVGSAIQNTLLEERWMDSSREETRERT